MSTAIDTVRTDAEPTRTPDSDAESAERRTEESDVDAAETPPAAWLGGDGPVDVSDVSPARVAAYARRADGAVHFERKGGRTYLVAT